VAERAAIAAALRRDLTIDLVTTGARSGQPRTTEIWFMRVDGRVLICGTPGRRDWLANLRATPACEFRLKESCTASLPARATEITDPEDRRAILTAPATEWYRRQGFDLDALVDGAPMAEIAFEAPFDDLLPLDR
jgi:deazaflavin-dependent oxidoreductase (nitroreductase family)